MSLESSFNFIDDLDSSNPAAGDNPSEGDDHLRGVKNAVKGSFTSLGSTAVTKTAAQINDLVEQTDPVLNGTISGTAFLDEDDLASDSATALASQQSIKAYIDGKGLSQVVSAEDAVYQSTSTTIPHDNTVPTNTEGSSLVNLSITPNYADSVIEIEFSGMFDVNNAGNVAVQLRDTTANTCLYCTSYRSTASVDSQVPVSFCIQIASPGTSANGYEIRYGPNAGTAYANGTASGSRFGAAGKCVLIAREIK